MFKKSLFITILIYSFSQAATINIAVAANVSYAMQSLIKEFNKSHNKTKIRVILGSSGKLTAQIKNGAPYDLFMSANMKYPQALYEENIALTKPIIYAQGSLAILSKKQKDFTKGIKLLQDSSIKKIAIANPKTAPYGIATIQALKNANLYKNAKRKFVYGESISQTVTYSIIAADIGFIAKSSLYSSKMKQYQKNIHWTEVDSNLYTPINQGIVILKQAKNNRETKTFYDFILSKKAQKIFQSYGYLIP